MQEIEARFSVSPAECKRVNERLSSLGAACMWKGVEKNIFYDTPGTALAVKNASLRLREWKGAGSMLTIKIDRPKTRPRTLYKKREEHQVIVQDFSETRRMLEMLGFVRIEQYKKYREHWHIGKCFIELDRVYGKHFVEIEGPPSDINRLVDLLGLHWKHATTQSYRAFVQSFRRKKQKTS